MAVILVSCDQMV